MRSLNLIAGPAVAQLLKVGTQRLPALADRLGAVQVGNFVYYDRALVEAFAIEHPRPDTTGLITIVEAARIADLTPTRLIAHDAALRPVIFATGKTTRRYYRAEVVIEFSRTRAEHGRGRDGRAARRQNAKRDRQP